MEIVLIVAVSVFGVLVLLAVIAGVLKVVTTMLRARGRREIEKRFTAGDVVLSDTMANFFGLESKGPMQLRGNGVLVLTGSELCFVMFVPEQELRIPVSSMSGVSIVRSHLGKTVGRALLHVRYTEGGRDEAIAWYVADPAAWKAKLESMGAPAGAS